MGSRQWLTYAGAGAGAGDATTARQAYRQVLRLDPTNAVAQNNLADLLRQSNDAQSLKEAESLVNQAIASHGNDPDAFNFYDTLARILIKEGRADDAIAAFEKGNAIDPKNLDILIGLAAECASNNRTNAAIRYLSQIDGLLSPGDTTKRRVGGGAGDGPAGRAQKRFAELGIGNRLFPGRKIAITLCKSDARANHPRSLLMVVGQQIGPTGVRLFKKTENSPMALVVIIIPINTYA